MTRLATPIFDYTPPSPPPLADWLRIFWSISQEQKCSQIWDTYRNTAKGKYFHYRTNSVKSNDQFFQYIKKTLFLVYFWSIFPIFGAKNFFSRKSSSVTQNFIWVSRTCQNSEKTKDTNSNKIPRRKDGKSDGQTLFNRTLPATAGSSKRCHCIEKWSSKLSSNDIISC